MLKKILCLGLALLVGCFVWISQKRPLFYGFSSTYELYIGEGGSLSQFVTATDENFLRFNRVMGESCVIFDENFNVKEFFSLFGGRIVMVERTENGCSFYGYSKRIKYLEKIGGKMVNLHAHISNDIVKVGSPIIYGSF